MLFYEQINPYVNSRAIHKSYIYVYNLRHIDNILCRICKTIFVCIIYISLSGKKPFEEHTFFHIFFSYKDRPKSCVLLCRWIIMTHSRYNEINHFSWGQNKYINLFMSKISTRSNLISNKSFSTFKM